VCLCVTHACLKTRFERFGVKLYGKDIVYNLDNTTTKGTKSRSQLEATPITLYNSDYTYYLGSQIAVNDNYICYAVRGEWFNQQAISTTLTSYYRQHDTCA
jgi:hypothetical protein